MNSNDVDNFTCFNHFSADELAEIKDRRAENKAMGYKPVGLWFCRDHTWIDWCQSSGFATGNYRYRYPIKEIIDLSRILVIDNNLESIKAFIDKYGASVHGTTLINWDKIAKEYHGVYLPNPVGKFRWDLFKIPGGSVFLALDVDSLVIFDPSIIVLGDPEVKEWLN